MFAPCASRTWGLFHLNKALMRRFYSKLLLTLCMMGLTATSFAQLNGSGYYRIQNKATQDYLQFVSDVTQKIDLSQASIDIGNIRSIYNDFDRVRYTPATVMYVEIKQVLDATKKVYNCDIQVQGASAEAFTGYLLRFEKRSTTGTEYYTASAKGTVSGVSALKYIMEDCGFDYNTFQYADGVCTAINDYKSKGDNALFTFCPMDQGDQFFGIKPRLEVGGKHYEPFYASFPFDFQSTGMRAFYVTRVTDDGYAIYQEVSGKVPGGTPIIVECSSADFSQNKLSIVGVTPQSLPSANKLKGVYFNWCSSATDPIAKRTKYDANTMRVLGKTADGKLGFVKGDYDYLPANTAYLPVATGTAAELKLVSEAEYALISGIEGIAVDKKGTVSGIYNHNGTKVGNQAADLKNLPKGTYIVNGKHVVK